MKYSLLDIFMNKGKRIEGPTFIKEFDDSSELIKAMEGLAAQIKATSVLDEIELDIGFIKSGDIGEKNVHFELKNSFIPMLVLHNLVVQYDDYKAQLDFVLVTSKFICILETKKLNGHITINSNGDFIRTLVNRQGKAYKREGMYSPVSQNQRHVRILENLLHQEKVVRKTPVLSLVVMANPKSIIDSQSAAKEIKQQIVRCDQLVPCIKRMVEQWKEVDLTPTNMIGIADFLNEHHIENENAFLIKYKKYLITEGMSIESDIPPVKIIPNPMVVVPIAVESVADTSAKAKLRDALMKFRLDQSRAENMKAFYIFNNAQMECLLERMPVSLESLMACDGFGPGKAQKYGLQILGILKGE